MISLIGIGVSGESCIGTLSFYRKNRTAVPEYKISDTQAELCRFEQAHRQAIEELKELQEQAGQKAGGEEAAIFEIHQMMLQDQDYCGFIRDAIQNQHANASYAADMAAGHFSEMFSAMEDEYMRGRAADVRDISERLIRLLNDGQADTPESLFAQSGTEGFILAADDLAPSETIQLDREKVLAIVLRHGSQNSHTAILARSLGIPAVIGLGDGLSEEYEGMQAAVDGAAGKVYICPDTETLHAVQAKSEQAGQRRSRLSRLKGTANMTNDGKKIELYANIGSISEIKQALENDAGGIGLFRSEFLYLENTHLPAEDEQFAAYRQAAEAMGGRKVIIRTLDLGADKQADYFPLEAEENPALGFRAIRICLAHPDLFKTQLRALYRAAAYGNISIMYPMITSVEEVEAAKKIAAEAQQELAAGGIPFRSNVETGIMIETPAAALISSELAPMVDFFSIGTNDLTQYTLAADRQNPNIGQFINPHHKAVMRLIKMVVDNAHQAGIWVGICGELGGDISLTRTFLKMGLDELSVPPGLVLPVRDAIQNIDLSQEEKKEIENHI